MVDVIRSSAIRTRPKSGTAHNGDGAQIFRGDDHALIVVVDGLGQGEVAENVAKRALQAAAAVATQDVELVIAAIHTALRGTAGAAAIALRVAHQQVGIAGVGNLEVRGPGVPSVSLSPGILGFQHAPLEVLRVRASGRLAIFTDGLSPGLDPSPGRSLDVDRAADALFRQHAVSFDDATLVLVDL